MHPNRTRRIADALRLATLFALLPPAHAAVLTLDKTTGCPGDTVRITGAGWAEPPPSCHYRFLFDPTIGSFQEVASRQPNGLFGPPNATVTIPANAQAGPHTFRVELWLDSGEFVQSESQAFRVAESTFEGATDCAKDDGGFDALMTTPMSPWLSVVAGDRKGVKIATAKILPASAAADLRFQSEPMGALTIRPDRPAGRDTLLDVKAAAAGSAKVQVANANDPNSVCGELNVVAYERKTVRLAVHIVQMKDCARPSVRVSKGRLEKGLNNIWDQAGVRFRIAVFQKHTGRRAIDADANGDCIVDEQGNCGGYGEDMMRIHEAINSPNVDAHVYFVTNYECPLALYTPVPPVIFAEGFEDQATMELDTTTLIAHELGHHLTLAHCDTGGAQGQCAGARQYLMHSANTGCLLQKPEWDAANAAADSR